MSYEGEGGGAGEATPTTTGIVLIDKTPTAGSPISLTAMRYGAVDGVARLGGDKRVPSFELPPNPVIGVDEADRWTRSAANPVLIGTEAWEEDTVLEPNVLHENGIFKLWYRGGGWDTTSSLGYATSTDGANFTKYSTDPIFGEGFGGYAGSVLCPNIFKHADYYYLYFTDTLLGGGDLYVSRSADGITSWSAPVKILDSATYGFVNQFANSHVWVEEGNQFHMLHEGRLSAGTWFIMHSTSTDLMSGWAVVSGGGLTDLQVAAGGMYGGSAMPHPPKRNGQYVLYYHAAPGSGNLPTNIYRSESADLAIWSTPELVLEFAGGGFEDDQVADPCVLEVDGKSYLYYDGDDNVAENAAVGLLVFDGTLDNLAGKTGRTAWLGADDLIPLETLPIATVSSPGIVQPDGTTITIVAGVISGAVDGIYAPLSTGDPADPLILDADGRILVGLIG